MSKSIGYMFIDNRLTLVINGAPFDVDPNHPKYKDIVARMVRPQDETDAEEAERAATLLAMVRADSLDERELSAQLGIDDIKIEHGVVMIRGKELRNSLTTRILDLKRAGLPYDPFVKFLINLEQNPSEESRESLFDFLEQGRFPLTDDGCFLGYKGVVSGVLGGVETLVDSHTHSFDMSPGNIHEMPWDSVDSNRNEACRAGFHVGTLGHAQSFVSDKPGAKMILVKVNPKDCVSVPLYDKTKLRCCRYEVVGLYRDVNSAKELSKPVYDETSYRDSSFTEKEEEEQSQAEVDEMSSLREELMGMSRDVICRKAAAECLFSSTNEARDMGKEFVIETILCKGLPLETMTRDQMAQLAVRRHLFSSTSSALKAGRDSMVSALLDSQRALLSGNEEDDEEE